MPCTVHRPNKPPQVVKNLRWLLDRASEVQSFVVRSPRESQQWEGQWEVELVARFTWGVEFRCEFASRAVLWDFLHRPSFVSLPLDWFGSPLTLKASKPGPAPEAREDRP
jgi:hypothetical protein